MQRLEIPFYRRPNPHDKGDQAYGEGEQGDRQVAGRLCLAVKRRRRWQRRAFGEQLPPRLVEDGPRSKINKASTNHIGAWKIGDDPFVSGELPGEPLEAEVNLSQVDNQGVER